jgi:hypothetical protein
MRDPNCKTTREQEVFRSEGMLPDEETKYFDEMCDEAAFSNVKCH